MVEIVLAILLVISSAVIAWLHGELKATRREFLFSRQMHARILFETKHHIRRLTRERRKWELAAATAMGIRLKPLPPPAEMKPIKGRVVGPREAINRERDRQAGIADIAPPEMSASKVPAPIANGFLKEAK